MGKDIYTEADRGRFDAYLLRNGIAVAYTDYDVVKVTDNFRYNQDYDAVAVFADGYELPLDISVWA